MTTNRLLSISFEIIDFFSDHTHNYLDLNARFSLSLVEQIQLLDFIRTYWDFGKFAYIENSMIGLNFIDPCDEESLIKSKNNLISDLIK